MKEFGLVLSVLWVGFWLGALFAWIVDDRAAQRVWRKDREAGR